MNQNVNVINNVKILINFKLMETVVLDIHTNLSKSNLPALIHPKWLLNLSMIIFLIRI